MMEQTSNRKRIQWVVGTALLLALLVIVQLLSKVIPASVPIVSQLLTGSLVNLVLIVGAGSVGFSAAVVASILSPVLAFAMAQMPFVPMIPVVMVGNIIIVAVTWAFLKRKGAGYEGVASLKNILGIIVGAAAKFAFLWAATALIVVPAVFSGKPQVASKLLLMFSWPQLLTAFIGGMLALLVLPSLRPFRRDR